MQAQLYQSATRLEQNTATEAEIMGDWLWDIGYGLLAMGDGLLVIGYGLECATVP